MHLFFARIYALPLPWLLDREPGESIFKGGRALNFSYFGLVGLCLTFAAACHLLV